MPPTDRFVISFAAEPPQDSPPYGRWADTLRQHFVGAVDAIDTQGEELGAGQRIAIRVHPVGSYISAYHGHL
jgi:hypothetical protein